MSAKKFIGPWGRVEVILGTVEVILGPVEVVLGRMRSWVVGFFRKLGLAFVSYIGNISRVLISHRIGDNLDTSIGKSYTVLTIGRLFVTDFILCKV